MEGFSYQEVVLSNHPTTLITGSDDIKNITSATLFPWGSRWWRIFEGLVIIFNSKLESLSHVP